MDWDGLRETVKKQGMRNSNVMAIAPTATIANITGVSQSIEPTYQNLYVKSNLSGEFTVTNIPMVENLKKLGPKTPTRRAGSVLRRAGGVLGHLRISSGRLVPSWGALGASWRSLGPFSTEEGGQHGSKLHSKTEAKSFKGRSKNRSFL